VARAAHTHTLVGRIQGRDLGQNIPGRRIDLLDRRLGLPRKLEALESPPIVALASKANGPTLTQPPLRQAG